MAKKIVVLFILIPWVASASPNPSSNWVEATTPSVYIPWYEDYGFPSRGYLDQIRFRVIGATEYAVLPSYLDFSLHEIIRLPADFYIREVSGWVKWPSVSATSIFSSTQGFFSSPVAQWKQRLEDHQRIVTSTWRPYVEIGDVVFDRHLNFESYPGNPLADRSFFVQLSPGYQWDVGQRFFSFYTVEDVSAVEILQGYTLGRGMLLRLPGVHSSLVAFNRRLTMVTENYQPFQPATRFLPPVATSDWRDSLYPVDGYVLFDSSYVALAIYDQAVWRKAWLGYMTYQPTLPGTVGMMIWDPFVKRKFLFDGSCWRVVIMGSGAQPTDIPDTFIEGFWLYQNGNAYVWNGTDWQLIALTELPRFDSVDWSTVVLGYTEYQPSISGDLWGAYWDETVDRMYVWDGSDWRIVLTGYGSIPAILPVDPSAGYSVFYDGHVYLYSGETWLRVITEV